MNTETVVYEGIEGKSFPVLTDGETVWLSAEQMANLFGRDVSVIGKHVNNVFREGELDILPNRQILPICGKIHPVAFYSLDVVIHSEKVVFAAIDPNGALSRLVGEYPDLQCQVLANDLAVAQEGNFYIKGEAGKSNDSII